MVWAAVLLLATPGAVAAPCPAPVLAFAPPLDAPIVLHRGIERELADGLFVHEASYRLTFSRAGRGYRLHWQQLQERSDGPPALLRLLELQERSVAGESFDVTLDESGAVLGISESPESAGRLAAAIDRLRADSALDARPAAQRAQIHALLDRLAALSPAERLELQRARLERPVMLAGRPCASGQVQAAGGTIYRVLPESGDALQLSAAHESVREATSGLAVTDAITLSRTTGLVTRFDRHTVTTVAGTARHARESFRLESVPDAR